jgi:Nuclease-related domain
MSISIARRARAGRYAHTRYRQGLLAYRRRIRWPLLVVVAPLFAFALGAMLSRRLDPWSLAVGAAVAVGIALLIYTLDEPPQHIQKWRRGAEGERKTERALRPLERRGWRAEHDVQRDGKANLDHIVTGPAGAFLLETKNLTGTISFEDGVLVARQFDDEDEIFRYDRLASRLRGQAKELSARFHAETGRRTWVNAVAVIWGHFPAEQITHENVTYIHGDRLRGWLAEQPRSGGCGNQRWRETLVE